MTLHSDPWGSDNTTTTPTVPPQTPQTTFEDNFAPFTPLPDSEQYLASLEDKLRRIKNNPDILKQLADKREACMQNFLNSDTQFEEQDELNEPLDASFLRVLSQKQALTKGEIVQLLNHDQLENNGDLE